MDSKRGGDQMTSGSSDITPTHTIPTYKPAAVKLIKNLKINNATHGHFYFLSAPEGTSKTRTVSIQLLNGQQVPITCFRFLSQAKTQTIFHFSENVFLKQMNWLMIGQIFFLGTKQVDRLTDWPAPWTNLASDGRCCSGIWSRCGPIKGFYIETYQKRGGSQMIRHKKSLTF